MSDPHQAIKTALSSLVGGRVYPNKFPQEKGAPTWPAIRATYSFDNQPDQCGAGSEDDEDIRVQLDVCAESWDAAKALRTQALAAMADIGWIKQPGGGSEWDAEAKVHRFRDDFILYQSTP